MSHGLTELARHLRAGGRITKEQALQLYRHGDLQQLYALALERKQSLHGNQVFWVNNRQINYTNICVLHCSFCAFSKIRKDSPVAYDWDHETVLAKAWQAVELGATELHIVGGLHPDHDFSYYMEMLAKLRRAFPRVGLKAFTAVEIYHFAKLAGCAISEILQQLKAVGLDALPGGGAEILVESVREKICGPKETGAQWLEVHRAAHNLGIPSNATMLFGHVETLEHRVEHMAYLRDLQDETGGFFAFIPLVFHPSFNSLGRKVGEMTSEEDRLRTIAVSRLFLDNFPHIKAYWVHLGLAVAVQALKCGASDFDGTIIEERITHAAGAETPAGLSALHLQELVRSAGAIPVERNALYDLVKR